MTIIDQVGTVDVELWVKNESGASVSATCAVIVTSGTVHELYRGSAAFSLVSIEPHSSRHLLEGVTGVYLDGDATGPIGPRYLPLPQYAKNARGRLSIACRGEWFGVTISSGMDRPNRRHGTLGGERHRYSDLDQLLNDLLGRGSSIAKCRAPTDLL